MRMYELALVIRTTLSEAGRKKLVDSVKELLKGLKIEKVDELGQKVLSYPIKKERDGFYYILHVEGESGMPVDLEKKLMQNEQVLRHLVIRKK